MQTPIAVFLCHELLSAERLVNHLVFGRGMFGPSAESTKVVPFRGRRFAGRQLVKGIMPVFNRLVQGTLEQGTRNRSRLFVVQKVSCGISTVRK